MMTIMAISPPSFLPGGWLCPVGGDSGELGVEIAGGGEERARDVTGLEAVGPHQLREELRGRVEDRFGGVLLNRGGPADPANAPAHTGRVPWPSRVWPSAPRRRPGGRGHRRRPLGQVPWRETCSARR